MYALFLTVVIVSSLFETAEQKEVSDWDNCLKLCPGYADEMCDSFIDEGELAECVATEYEDCLDMYRDAPEECIVELGAFL